jgi:predicted DsbA family dithiol-disulfide isomerase
MRVDIWSDVVCPWCYVGKARFEKALADFGDRDEVEVVYRSFELDPSQPKKPTETVFGMLSRKYGLSPAGARSAEGRVAGLAEAEGLGFRLDRPVGNTFDVHRVLQYGRAVGIQRELIAAVNRAYFGDGRAVFDDDVLTGVAASAGAEAAEVGGILAGDAYADAVRQDEREARAIGIGGVPFFLFGRALAVSGAQPVATFAEALRQAGARVQ